MNVQKNESRHRVVNVLMSWYWFVSQDCTLSFVIVYCVASELKLFWDRWGDILIDTLFFRFCLLGKQFWLLTITEEAFWVSGIKKYIVGLIIKTSCDAAQMEKEKVYVGKLNMILVQVHMLLLVGFRIQDTGFWGERCLSFVWFSIFRHLLFNMDRS